MTDHDVRPAFYAGEVHRTEKCDAFGWRTTSSNTGEGDPGTEGMENTGLSARMVRVPRSVAPRESPWPRVRLQPRTPLSSTCSSPLRNCQPPRISPRRLALWRRDSLVFGRFPRFFPRLSPPPVSLASPGVGERCVSGIKSFAFQTSGATPWVVFASASVAFLYAGRRFDRGSRRWPDSPESLMRNSRDDGRL